MIKVAARATAAKRRAIIAIMVKIEVIIDPSPKSPEARLCKYTAAMEARIEARRSIKKNTRYEEIPLLGILSNSRTPFLLADGLE